MTLACQMMTLYFQMLTYSTIWQIIRTTSCEYTSKYMYCIDHTDDMMLNYIHYKLLHYMLYVFIFITYPG